jgi:hypothetical protein
MIATALVGRALNNPHKDNVSRNWQYQSPAPQGSCIVFGYKKISSPIICVRARGKIGRICFQLSGASLQNQCPHARCRRIRAVKKAEVFQRNLSSSRRSSLKYSNCSCPVNMLSTSTMPTMHCDCTNVWAVRFSYDQPAFSFGRFGRAQTAFIRTCYAARQSHHARQFLSTSGTGFGGFVDGVCVLHALANLEGRNTVMVQVLRLG